MPFGPIGKLDVAVAEGSQPAYFADASDGGRAHANGGTVEVRTGPDGSTFTLAFTPAATDW
jgi:hypothetical protein